MKYAKYWGAIADYSGEASIDHRMDVSLPFLCRALR
jgi:hypothetical protein